MAQTAGKGAKNAESAHHKLSTVQPVKSNQKGIIDAGKKLKTLRAMKEEKKKRDAFYFIHTEATVDTCAHWDDLQCGVITDDSEEDNTAILSVPKT